MPIVRVRPAWCGDPPEKCDLCKNIIGTTFVDGATTLGAWACMCVLCHRMHGQGLGTGKGQQYRREADDVWYKLES